MSLISDKSIDFPKVMAYLGGDLEKSNLTDKDVAVCDRWMWIERSYHRLKSKNKLVKAVMQEFGMSQTQAYTDIKMVEHIFGQMNKVQKMYELNFALEIARKGISEGFETGDLRSAASFLQQFVKMLRLDQLDLSHPDYKERLPPVIRGSDSTELLESPLTPQEHKMLEQYRKISKPKIQHDADATTVD